MSKVFTRELSETDKMFLENISPLEGGSLVLDMMRVAGVMKGKGEISHQEDYTICNFLSRYYNEVIVVK